jgi:hypothetical protein
MSKNRPSLKIVHPGINDTPSEKELKEATSWERMFPKIQFTMCPLVFLQFPVPTYKLNNRTVGRHTLTPHEVLLLSYLIDRHRYLAGDFRWWKKDGYYFHTRKDLKLYCKISPFLQKRYFRSLKEIGVINIDIRIEGITKSRWVKINVDEINRLAEKHKLRDPE